jgi:hypothetical protein
MFKVLVFPPPNGIFASFDTSKRHLHDRTNCTRGRKRRIALEQTRSDALVVTQNESKIFLQLFLLSFPVVCTPTFPWFAACLPAIPFRVETTPFNIVEIYDDG